MLGLIIIIYLAYRNGLIAKLKGKSPTKWVLLSIASYLVFYVIGIMAVLIILVNSGQIDIYHVQQTQAGTQALTNQMVQIMSDNPIHIITMEAFGIGGYLLIRFILERMPAVNVPKDNDGE